MPRAIELETIAAKKTASPKRPALAKKAPPDAFEGFADRNAAFFFALAKNQDRDWFAAHKEEFELGWNKPMAALLAEVAAGIDSAFPDCDIAPPKLFRIYRDVRFGKDKSPYKTHTGGLLMARSRRAESVTEVPIALYMQVGTETFAAAGQYMMTPDSLAKFRAAVVDAKRGPELVKILTKLRAQGFEPGAYAMMANVPRGFEAQHPRADLLKYKGLIVRFPAVPTELLTSPDLVKWLSKQVQSAAPLVRWLVFATA